jgi:hypothetical protein
VTVIDDNDADDDIVVVDGIVSNTNNKLIKNKIINSNIVKQITNIDNDSNFLNSQNYIDDVKNKNVINTNIKTENDFNTSENKNYTIHNVNNNTTMQTK